MNQPRIVDAIKTFLTKKTHSNLAALYNENMEVQVNVAQDNGVLEKGEYKGRQYSFYEYEGQRWKHLRIPYGANDNPVYDLDKRMSYDLALHAEGIGLTGWDWKNKVSKFCIYDFDSIIGHSDKHSAKISNEEMQRVREEASKIEWVTVRRSTGGNGLHLHVDLPDVPTNNHNEHSALARAILSQMSGLVGYNFEASVDICGGNTWFWHRKMLGTEGLTTIKEASNTLDIDEVPTNWRDHIKVANGKSRRAIPKAIIEAGLQEQYEEMIGSRQFINLEETHKELFSFLTSNGYYWHWDSDANKLVTHTTYLEHATKSLNYKGYFKTSSSHSSEYNCFCFPIRGGGWVVRRYSKGTKEHDSWSQDGAGWTKCLLNHPIDFHSACKAMKGIYNPDKNAYLFREAQIASQVALLLDQDLEIPKSCINNSATLRLDRANKLVIDIEIRDDQKAEGWYVNYKKGIATTATSGAVKSEAESDDSSNTDSLIRHLVANGKDAGWVVRQSSGWVHEPVAHVKAVAKSLNIKSIEKTIGDLVLTSWEIVNRPFKPEYPGGREWNKEAAQLTYFPEFNKANLSYPTWTKLLNHIGKNLDPYVKVDPWCVANGVMTGGDYLFLWVASVFQYPEKPLPYLFLYSREQSTGKSTFHISLRKLLTKGYTRADDALTNQQGFNGELQGAILAIVEETDVNGQKRASNRMKDWVTSPTISIHPKGGTPFMSLNTCHWIHTGNDESYCPNLSNDTRITMINVKPIAKEEYILESIFNQCLDKEAQDFTTALMSAEIPESNDRLRIPMIATQEKLMTEVRDACPLEQFIKTAITNDPGQKISYDEFYDAFISTLDKSELSSWPKRGTSKRIPVSILQGLATGNKRYLGNVYWKNKTAGRSLVKGRYILIDGKLRLNGDENEQG